MFTSDHGAAMLRRRCWLRNLCIVANSLNGPYGGPTQTIPLLYQSPAIDAGNPSGCTDSQGHLLKTDQRGQPRPNTEDIKDKRGCDIGAYETQGN